MSLIEIIEDLQTASAQEYNHRPWRVPAQTAFRDGDLIRCYYRGKPGPVGEDGRQIESGRQVYYAESLDGINFTRPSLGLYEVHAIEEGRPLHDFAYPRLRERLVADGQILPDLAAVPTP